MVEKTAPPLPKQRRDFANWWTVEQTTRMRIPTWAVSWLRMWRSAAAKSMGVKAKRTLECRLLFVGSRQCLPAETQPSCDP